MLPCKVRLGSMMMLVVMPALSLTMPVLLLMLLLLPRLEVEGLRGNAFLSTVQLPRR